AALLRKDSAFLHSFKPAPSRRTNRWFSAIYVCLRCIVEKLPELVAAGLDKLLGARSIWNWEELKVICLEPDGIYELARWVSPDLVSAFDIHRPLPWDREFRTWACANESPLKEVRLPRLPPDIHNAIMYLQRPPWLKFSEPNE